MYVKPMEKAGDILADPKSKLELYIAYRLSSTSIWAILVANVAGYMLIRAAANRTLGYLRAALVDANNAVELNPHNLDALLERGLVHKALGDKASAWADWQAAVKYAKDTGREDDPAALAAAHYLSQ